MKRTRFHEKIVKRLNSVQNWKTSSNQDFALSETLALQLERLKMCFMKERRKTVAKQLKN